MDFYFKQLVRGKCGISFEGIIQGKLKGNAYILLVTSSSTWSWSLDNTMSKLKKIYGSPIRHLDLEWGSFANSDKEIVIPAQDISS